MADLDYYTCYTLFDITSTAVSNTTAIPFKDAAGQMIEDSDAWERSRNQQRNWDTMVQIISMRAQPIALSRPRIMELEDHYFSRSFSGKQRIWYFTFGVEAREVFRRADDPVWALENDSNMVPMSIGLTETADLIPACILTDAISFNTCFKIGNIT